MKKDVHMEGGMLVHDVRVCCRTYGEICVRIFETVADLGAAAAADLAAIVASAIATKGEASIILATGNSQLQFMQALRKHPGIEWGKVRVFHMDEYLGMSENHPASFRRYLREKLTDIVRPLAFYGILGDAPDADAEMRRYEAFLARYPADACVMGIGENGHLAFNDPPTDFNTPSTMQVVRMDESCRRQQVGEGHFKSLGEVPERALTLTVPALLAAKRLLVVVPERRKAEAVRATLEGPVTPLCPASILQRQAHAVLYLDREASLLLAAPRSAAKRRTV